MLRRVSCLLQMPLSLQMLWNLEMLPLSSASPEEQVRKVIDRFAQKMEGTRQKRHRPDVLQQACIVLHYKQCKNYRATARKFHLSSNSGVKQVSGYVKKKATIMELLASEPFTTSTLPQCK